MLPLFKRLLTTLRTARNAYIAKRTLIKNLRNRDERTLDLLAADLIENAIVTKEYGANIREERFMCIALMHTKHPQQVFGYGEVIRRYAKNLIMDRLDGHGTLFGYLHNTNKLPHVCSRSGADAFFVGYFGIPYYKNLVKTLREKHEPHAD